MARRYGEDPDAPKESQRDRLQSNSAGTTNKIPSAKEVSDFHRNSDVDTRPEALHHTVGPLPSQAAAGNHNHRDGQSTPILEGVTIIGSKAGSNAVVFGSIVAALKALGATDATT